MKGSRIAITTFALITGFSDAVPTATVELSIPPKPPAGHLTVDANYQSYSIEFSYMNDYAGNNTHPNKFSHELLQNLEDISGALPIIRAGGTTSNRATYYPNQTDGVILIYNHGTWEDQPDAMSIGPNWHQSFRQFPKGTKYIYNLNFYDGQAGLKQTVLEASAAWDALGESIYAFEIGNEPNGWAGTSRRPANWTRQDYVAQWKQFAKAIAANTSLPEPRFQGCAFTAPRNLSRSPVVWNVANVLQDGLAEGGYLATVADHDYMGANQAPLPTLAKNLLDHFHMTSLFRYHEALGNQTKALGIDYVIGETNSISKQGTANVSDVFGAALWGIDYVLYSAGTNVSRMYFHMGTPYRYSAWQPIIINGTAPFAKPLYYGNLFTAKALAGGNKQVVGLVNTTSLTAYGIYSTSKLESVAVVNLEEFNATMSVSRRNRTVFRLPSSAGDWSKATVRRLTAPGVDTKENITFAGQHVDASGRIVGTEKTEGVLEDKVSVTAGEAVLISL
ncbi:glycoside hydrolase superfamily [Lophiotrema nucula]|uniref:Glycoside hydrolase superfamily n=1 Tax=Lophiotrema nucula TaxID=690887 RepID=A0A6A5ZFR9_9PLEO|nr:glycoside hydrolase superfamily [Lophiotrema nucula]